MKVDNLIALVGLPRSGTTIIARCIGLHSQVSAIIEPYQSRRHENYLETDYEKICADFGVLVPEAGSLLIKETGTRVVNIERTMLCLRQAIARDVRGGVVVVLRSPVEAFVSQFEAAGTLWGGNAGFAVSPDSIQAFWRVAKRSLNVLRNHLYSFPRRLVLYERFVREPEQELARVMGLFPYRLEASQLAPDPSRVKKIVGGDPKSADLQRGVSAESRTDRGAQVKDFGRTYSADPGARQMMRIHRLLEEIIADDLHDDDEIAAAFFRTIDQG